MNESIVTEAKNQVLNGQVSCVYVCHDTILSQRFKAHSNASNTAATLQTVGDDVDDIKKEQSALQGRVTSIEEKLDLVLDIMQSRYRPPVERV